MGRGGPEYIPPKNQEQLNKPREGQYPTWDLERTQHIIKETGWNDLAEVLLDSANWLPKPNDPSIPRNDIEALDEDGLLSQSMDADDWEETIVNTLEDGGRRYLVPQFKQQMEDYRKKVKSTVQLWREGGLL